MREVTIDTLSEAQLRVLRGVQEGPCIVTRRTVRTVEVLRRYGLVIVRDGPICPGAVVRASAIARKMLSEKESCRG